MQEIALPMPKPSAQVQPFVDAIGVELTVSFLLAYGGAELYLADDPKGRSSHEIMLGYDAAKALAASAHLLPRRVPLANVWLARMLKWQGHSHSSIARKLRKSDVSVRRWLQHG